MRSSSLPALIIMAVALLAVDRIWNESIKKEPLIHLSKTPSAGYEAVNTGIFMPLVNSLFRLSGKKRPAVDEASVSRKIYHYYLTLLYFFRFNILYFTIAGICIMLMGLLFIKSGIYFLSSVILRSGFFVSRLLINICAGVIIAGWILINKGYFIVPDLAVFAGSAILLFFTAISLKIYDPNFPLWNRTTASVILPAVSFLAATVSGILI